jgi:hypothetical protein
MSTPEQTLEDYQRMLGEALDLLEKSWAGLRTYRAKLNNLLGATEEERALTFKTLEDLTPAQIREAIIQYKEHQEGA